MKIIALSLYRKWNSGFPKGMVEIPQLQAW